MNVNSYLTSLFLLLQITSRTYSQVIDLNVKHFNTLIGKYDTLFVLFYEPSDAGTPLILSEFEKAAEKMLKNVPPVLLAKVITNTLDL